MRKVDRFIQRNWLWIVLGLILTRYAVEYAYEERGYAAYGGEWLVAVFFPMAVSLARDIMDFMADRIDERKEAERDGGIKADSRGVPGRWGRRIRR